MKNCFEFGPAAGLTFFKQMMVDAIANKKTWQIARKLLQITLSVCRVLVPIFVLK